LTTKLHAAVDEKGRPLRLLLSKGNRNDITQAPELLKDMGLADCFVLADKGYDSTDFVLQVEEAGGIAVIPSRATNRVQRDYDKEIYKCRNLVERFFNRMKQFRRFATRYEKTAKSFLALIHFVAVFVFLAIDRL
jgi:transposase